MSLRLGHCSVCGETEIHTDGCCIHTHDRDEVSPSERAAWDARGADMTGAAPPEVCRRCKRPLVNGRCPTVAPDGPAAERAAERAYDPYCDRHDLIASERAEWLRTLAERAAAELCGEGEEVS
jgi:hypothetical protein